VVLWITDEILGWDLFPDWIGRYAQLIVIVLSVLAASAVITSLICSFAVMAESAARKAGMPEIAPSRRARVFVAGGVLAFFGVLFVLHEIDVYRQAHLRKDEQAQALQRYRQAHQDLRARIPGTVSLFSAAATAYLAGSAPTTVGDADAGQLLRAIRASTPHNPSASVLLRAQSPYQYCVLRVPSGYQDSTQRRLAREYFTDLPSQWERDAIAALFEGRQVAVPRGRDGAFLDTNLPSAWGVLKQDGRVVGILLLRPDGG
jgi:hypothetical protein